MWQGIKNNNGNVTINTAGGATIFEDAIEAIESTAGDVNIRYAKFKENHIGLQFINYNQSPDNNATELGLLGIELSWPDMFYQELHLKAAIMANIDLVDG
ncbi:MAG: hypothetical protein IPP71_08935 [Bacteroidetes bacterium]|nr:hypothetical protein [Bacteroidota bacterium]